MKRIQYRDNGIKLFVILTIFACVACSTNNRDKRPNIIIILADDMGFSDLGCTGSEIETPNLDKMANDGALFTNFYNTSRCCPSRTSLLTGQYQWDAGMGHMDTDNSEIPEYQGYINEKSITIAEALKQGGYQTFMSGKWHIGSKERNMWPDYRGFDEFYGTPSGGGIYFYPSQFYDRPVFHNGKQVYPDSSWYSTDAFTDYALDFIKDRRKQNQPFFMYLAYVAPHFPLQAKEKDIDKYREKYKVGYGIIRQSRFEKQKRLGLFSANMEMSEAVVPHWDSIQNQDHESLEMAVYAAMVDCMDQNIGRIMNSLRDEGILDNTIVFFLSDNGACQTAWNKTPEAELGTRNSNAAYGVWYNVSNTPYRMRKSQEHEGGIITPMIVHWPSGIKRKGMRINSNSHINDFMPTCLELAGVEYPEKFNGKILDPLDGQSFLHLFNGQIDDEDRLLFWEHEGNKAVREGFWKLVALHNGEWELYNLENDPFEMENLVTVQPEIAKQLILKYKQWADEHGVKQWPLKN